MNNLNFDNGIKEIMVNGNPNAVIRICTNDFSLPVKFKKLYDSVDALISTMKRTPESIDKADKEIRAGIDELFGSNVSDAAFGSVNCLTFAGGKSIVVNFLEALMPLIRDSIAAETQNAEQRVAQYTAQLADIPQQ